MNLFRRRCCCGFLVIVLRLNLAFGGGGGSGWCDGERDRGAETGAGEFCGKTLQWRDFDWRSYVEKDWREEVDAPDPTLRFGVDLRRSIDIGAVREVPDNR